MARPLRIEYPGAFYHIIQRGNERKDIFISPQDRTKFYEYLSILHTRYKVSIHTYCLMDNHYHLILETKQPNLSNAIHYLNTSYTIYFNIKRKRSGHLFQGRYNAILIEADEYLHHLSRYIYLNPVRAGIVKNPIDYPYSSYRYFITDTKPPNWLTTGFILSLFDKQIKKAKHLYKNFVLEAIGSETHIIRNNTAFGFILGNQDFINMIKERFIQDKKDKEVPVLNLLKNQLNPSDIIEKVNAAIDNKKLSRKVSIYLIRKHTDLSLKEISLIFNKISDAGVSILYNRFERKRMADKKLNGRIADIEKMLNVET